MLGGEVDKLVEKWIVERDSTNEEFRIRSFEEGGPPPFIPFEKRNYKDNKHKVKHEDLSGRKVLRKDDEKNEDDDEFEAEREKQLAQIDAVRYVGFLSGILDKIRAPKLPFSNDGIYSSLKLRNVKIGEHSNVSNY